MLDSDGWSLRRAFLMPNFAKISLTSSAYKSVFDLTPKTTLLLDEGVSATDFVMTRTSLKSDLN